MNNLNSNEVVREIDIMGPLGRRMIFWSCRCEKEICYKPDGRVYKQHFIKIACSEINRNIIEDSNDESPIYKCRSCRKMLSNWIDDKFVYIARRNVKLISLNDQ